MYKQGRNALTFSHWTVRYRSYGHLCGVTCAGLLLSRSLSAMHEPKVDPAAEEAVCLREGCGHTVSKHDPVIRGVQYGVCNVEGCTCARLSTKRETLPHDDAACGAEAEGADRQPSERSAN
jgi:hypothetical protein